MGTIEQGFENLLKRLVPLSSERTKAISHRGSIRSCLVSNFRCSNLFETGSFGNKTGVRHFSDTDYFAVCPPENLRGKSSYVLRKVKEALQYTFPRTPNITVNSPSVKIPFGKFASEDIEITPCFYYKLTETPLGRKKTYAIPSGSGEWMLSSPQAHNAYVEKHNKRLGGRLKPLIQLVKAWKYYHNVQVSSFYLELRVTKFAEEKKNIIYDVDLYRIIKKLHDIELASIQDPMKVSGLIDACATDKKRETALSKLSTALSRASKACLSKEKSSDNCFYWWKMFFNGGFPSK